MNAHPATPPGRLYLVATPREHWSDSEFLARVRAALEGGVDTLQLRVKNREALPYLRLAERTAELARAFHVPLFVNDRPDVALAAGASGVHLGQQDRPPAWARRVAPELLIGRSTHAPEPARLAMREQATYFAVGPVFATPTKAQRPAVGLEYVRWAAQHADRPWYAIGGIDSSNLDRVLTAGATRVAVVRAILDAPDPALAAHAFQQQLQEVTTCK